MRAWQEGYAQRMAAYEREMAAWQAAQDEPRWQFRPEMGEAALAPFDTVPAVSALLGRRNCRNTQGRWKSARRINWAGGDGRLATRAGTGRLLGASTRAAGERRRWGRNGPVIVKQTTEQPERHDVSARQKALR